MTQIELVSILDSMRLQLGDEVSQRRILMYAIEGHSRQCSSNYSDACQREDFLLAFLWLLEHNYQDAPHLEGTVGPTSSATGHGLSPGQLSALPLASTLVITNFDVATL